MSDVRDQRRISPRPPRKAAASRPPRDSRLTATAGYIPGAPELRIPATMRSAVAIVALVAVAWPWLAQP
jgi:hypothetical protein